MEYVLIGLFLLLTALGVPVAFSLCLSTAAILLFHMDIPLVMVSQMMFSGIDSFSFMAVPFFMLAGAFMSAGGVTSSKDLKLVLYVELSSLMPPG